MYRDLGRDRSVDKTWKKCGYKHHSLVTQWCTKHNWVKRCSAFDEDELQKESIALQKLRLDRRLKMEKEAWVKHEKYAAKAKQMLNIPIATSLVTEDGKTVYNPTDKWTIKDAIALDEYAHKLAIFATGGDAPKLTEIFPTIFTPQGDGNSIAKFEGAIAESNSRQYLPRKGTETLKKTASEHKLLP